MYGADIIIILVCIAVVAFVSLGGIIASYFIKTGIFEGITEFVVTGFIVFLAFGITILALEKACELYTYIRTFFRYGYLPLTVKEASALGLDKDPVKYFKTLTEMMCYKRGFTHNVLAFQNNETDLKLSQLFYQLFLYKNKTHKPVIVEYLNDLDKLEALLTSMQVYEKRYETYESDISSKRPLIKSLNGFYEAIENIKTDSAQNQIVDAIAFKGHCHFVRKGDYDIRARAIIQAKNSFYLIGFCSYEIVESNYETIDEFLQDNRFIQIGSKITIES